VNKRNLQPRTGGVPAEREDRQFTPMNFPGALRKSANATDSGLDASDGAFSIRTMKLCMATCFTPLSVADKSVSFHPRTALRD